MGSQRRNFPLVFTLAAAVVTPAFGQAGTYSTVRLIASDGKLSRFATFAITVRHIDRPPQMVPLPKAPMAQPPKDDAPRE